MHSLRVATYLLGSLSQSKFSELSFLSFPLSTKAWEKPDHMVIQVQEAPDVIRLKYGWVHGRGISIDDGSMRIHISAGIHKYSMRKRYWWSPMLFILSKL